MLKLFAENMRAAIVANIQKGFSSDYGEGYKEAEVRGGVLAPLARLYVVRWGTLRRWICPSVWLLLRAQ